MDHTLTGKKIMILIANGFEEAHFTEIQRSLMTAGASLTVVAPENGLVNSWHGAGWGHYYPSDKPITSTLAADFDMLVIPGGERAKVKLEQNPHTARIVRSFVDGGKPIAALGQGVGLLAKSESMRGRMVSAMDAIAPAVTEAGMTVSPLALCEDGVILTGNAEAEVTMFIETMIAMFQGSAEMKQAA